MKRISRAIVRAACLAALSAGPSIAKAQALSCPSPLQAYTSINLYFGGDIPGGGKVSRAMFRRFLNATVTPRFPDGVTVTEVTGQYRYRNGRIVVEPSRMVTVLAKDAEEAGRKVDEIIAAYKQRFRQESVAREQRQECVAFQ
jgi:hypothetical protein